MDISVSRLNKRMALQLPAEFPLGLVFVVGKITELDDDGESSRLRGFYLTENDHTIYCRLSHRAALEVRLNEGDLVRAGGHLAFEPVLAGYYLQARDVEVLSEHRPGRSPLSEIIADNEQRIKAATLVPAELPPWIEQLAPPEIREELAQQKLASVDSAQYIDDSRKGLDKAETEEPAAAGLADRLVEFLSEAMESSEDVELTPDVLAEYDSDPQVAELSQEDQVALRELEAALIMTILKEGSSPETQTAQAIAAHDEEPAANGLDVDGQDALENDSREPPLPSLSEQHSEEQSESSQVEPIDDHPAQVLKEPDQSTSGQDKREQKTRSRQAVREGERSNLIPWYLVALAIFLAILLVTVFVFVTLNSSSLPLPFSFSG